MGEIADAAVDVEGAEKGDCPDDHDHVFGLHRKDEKEQNGLIRIQDTECEQKTENSARCANRVRIPITDDSIQRHITEAGADSTHKIVLEKTARAPVLLESGSEHPQREHVEQDMLDAAVQEHIGCKLP